MSAVAGGLCSDNTIRYANDDEILRQYGIKAMKLRW